MTGRSESYQSRNRGRDGPRRTAADRGHYLFVPGRPSMGMALTDYLDELSPGLLVLVGLVLVLFPEPATSALGAVLFLLGLAWLAYEWNRP